MSQPPARPWFRLASIVRPPPQPQRPPAPPPVQQQAFRPPVAVPQAAQATPPPPAPTAAPIPPRTSAPPSPIPPTTPAPMRSPVASPPPRATAPQSPPPSQATAPPSPAKTPPAALTSPATQSPKSPAKTGGSQPAPTTTRSPITTSPITKTSSSLPASPVQKASPKIAATRPDVSYSSLPESPKTKPSAPPPSPWPTSPAFRTVPSSPSPPQPSPLPKAAPIATVTARATTPIASPKIEAWVGTPPQSTKEKVLSRLPSPLTLPPAQLKAGSDLEPIPAEVEQKTVLLQETEKKSMTAPKTSNGHQQRSHGETHNHEIAQHGKREAKKDKGVHTHKKDASTEEFGVKVVTLAGENKGAIMELSPSRKKYGSGAWSNGGQKLKSNSDEEGSSRMKNEKQKAMATETAPMDAFINCNVQGVNNSILYDCSCSHKDPGVHLSVSRKGNGGHGVHRRKDLVID